VNFDRLTSKIVIATLAACATLTTLPALAQQRPASSAEARGQRFVAAGDSEHHLDQLGALARQQPHAVASMLRHQVRNWRGNLRSDAIAQQRSARGEPPLDPTVRPGAESLSPARQRWQGFRYGHFTREGNARLRAYQANERSVGIADRHGLFFAHSQVTRIASGIARLNSHQDRQRAIHDVVRALAARPGARMH
jgi:hypothetical protein